MKCSVKGCGDLHYGHGFCRRHYARWVRGADLNKPKEVHIPNRGCKVKGCKNKHDAHGYCSLHRQRWEKRGDPLAKPLLADDGAPAEFLARAVTYRGNQCLIWPYSRDNHGYARIARGKGISPGRVSRMVCIRVHGMPPPRGKYDASHTCGNGHLGCVNPMHLEWKTHAENQRDMIRHDSWGNQMRKRK